MFDAFTKVVSQADTRGEMLSPGQIDARQMVAESNKRLDAVNRITGNASAIVSNAARALFDEQAQLIAPGGNAYTNRRMAKLAYATWKLFCVMSPTQSSPEILAFLMIVA